MRWVTHLGGFWVTTAVSLALVAIDARLGLAVLVAVAMSGIVVQVLKRGFGRRRPWNLKTDKPLAVIKLPDPFSFPSGHSAAITAVTVTVSLYKPALTPFLLPVAALVAASRVMLLVHFLGDVLAGVSIGLAAAVAAWALVLR
jgi:undecaprenyl-diphosphatase